MAFPPGFNPAVPSRQWLYDMANQVQPNPAPPAGPPAPAPPVVPAPQVVGPPGIVIDTIPFTDWSHFIQVPNVPIARVETPEDVAAICNWAAANGYTVRAVGESHNWSPLLLVNAQAAGKVMLVDTKNLNTTSFAVVNDIPLATFGTGINLETATQYLQLISTGPGAANGYSLPHMPAPGNLSLGGMLAIGAHGTCVPSGTGEPDLMGSLSNLIVAFDAVVTDPAGPTPDTYTVRHFSRSETDAAAFLVHLGRAFLTAVTLRVVPNYYVQLEPLFPAVTDLFASPATVPLPSQAFSTLLDTYGRVEVLWFPFTDQGFVQCTKVQPTAIQPQVAGPYNYPWMNDISPTDSDLIAIAIQAFPHITPFFGAGELAFATTALAGHVPQRHCPRHRALPARHDAPCDVVGVGPATAARRRATSRERVLRSAQFKDGGSSSRRTNIPSTQRWRFAATPSIARATWV